MNGSVSGSVNTSLNLAFLPAIESCQLMKKGINMHVEGQLFMGGLPVSMDGVSDESGETRSIYRLTGWSALDMKPSRYLLTLALPLCGIWLDVSAQQGDFHRIDIGHAELSVVEWAADSPEAELILALPGSGGDYSRYKRVAPLLAAAGYRLVVLHQRIVSGR